MIISCRLLTEVQATRGLERREMNIQVPRTVVVRVPKARFHSERVQVTRRKERVRMCRLPRVPRREGVSKVRDRLLLFVYIPRRS